MQVKDNNRRLWLATDSNLVFILSCSSTARVKRYACQNGLTILKSDERELTDLAIRGAKLTDVPENNY